MFTSINIFGGPGTGKSTTAAMVFGRLKQLHKNAELSVEYAKTRVYEEQWKIFPDQIYIFAKMLRQYHRCEGKIDYMVADAPLLMSAVYARHLNHQYKTFEPLVIEAVNRYDNINVMLERTVDYQTQGRTQNEEEAEGIDQIIREVLIEYDQKIVTLPVDKNTVNEILLLVP